MADVFEKDFFERAASACGVGKSIDHQRPRSGALVSGLMRIAIAGTLTLASPAVLSVGEHTAVAASPMLGARIEQTPGVCGGAARVARTRIPVWTLVEARRTGTTDSELLVAFPTLSMDDLSAAWDYAARHEQQIEREIAAQEE